MENRNSLGATSNALYNDMVEEHYLGCMCHPETCPFEFVDSNTTENDSYMSEVDDTLASICNEIDTPYEIVPYWGRVTLVAIYSTTILLAVVGNLMVIVVLGCGLNQKRELHRYLLNLSISDLCMAIFCMPFTFIQGMLRRWIFGKMMCPFVLCAQQVSVTLSIFTLTAIGIDRCIAVGRPLQTHASKSRTKYVIPIIWIASLSLGITPLMKAKAVLMPEVNGVMYYQCGEWWEDPTHAVAYGYSMMIMTYIIPLVILGVTYSSIGKNIWNRNIPGSCQRRLSEAHVGTKKKVIRMLVIVVLAFALCWLPLQLFVVITLLDTKYLDDTSYHKSTITVYLLCHWLAMANSFMNPIIYSFNDEFREELMCTLYKVRHGRHPTRHRKWKTPSNGSSCRRSNMTIVETVNH
ncbi:prolactin-releasing peptide receptor-like [Glandiceps talaboti]